jgi:lipopolysaccharide transport system ATP-binding protein
MAQLALALRGIGKRYQIGGGSRHATLYDRIGGLVGGPVVREPAAGGEEFWALRDIGFEIARGEVVGILGRNGSGKSTLMKILAQVTNPTEGEADLYGRVGALLEVGMGFHPELSGRENIYLSGAILGMTRGEIAAAAPRIIDFADIERFIDTPVKRYSSGMFMRLAFSVSAHLEAEIMLVDEVLAVGDAAFQAKCQERIHELSRGGRTVLFVSHGMESVAALCDWAIVLDSGRMVYRGDTPDAIATYLERYAGLPPTHAEPASDAVSL